MGDEQEDQLVPMTVRFTAKEFELMRRQAAAIGMSVEEVLIRSMHMVFDRSENAIEAILDKAIAEQQGDRHLKLVLKD